MDGRGAWGGGHIGRWLPQPVCTLPTPQPFRTCRAAATCVPAPPAPARHCRQRRRRARAAARRRERQGRGHGTGHRRTGPGRRRPPPAAHASACGVVGEHEWRLLVKCHRLLVAEAAACHLRRGTAAAVRLAWQAGAQRWALRSRCCSSRPGGLKPLLGQGRSGRLLSRPPPPSGSSGRRMRPCYKPACHRTSRRQGRRGEASSVDGPCAPWGTLESRRACKRYSSFPKWGNRWEGGRAGGDCAFSRVGNCARLAASSSCPSGKGLAAPAQTGCTGAGQEQQGAA